MIPRSAALLGVALTLAGCRAAGPEASRPPVVLITIESLRSDHLAALGGASPTRPALEVMPVLEALSRESTLYADAHSVTSWTLASHASLFTGLYPEAHRCEGPRDRLDDSLPTLAEILRDAGYQTAGIVGGPYLRSLHNLNQGFEFFADDPAAPTPGLAHADSNNPALESAWRDFFARERDRDRPLFLFVYFWDPHYDFIPPPPYDRLFVPPDARAIDARSFEINPAIHAGLPPEQLRWILAQYAGELRWTDLHLGHLFDALRREGLWEEALIVVTADHGEEFFDHGAKGHKNNLHAETVHVPLWIKYPGQREAQRDDEPTSLVDVMPTVLDWLGLRGDRLQQGVSLRDPAARAERGILQSLLRPQFRADPAGGVVIEAGERWEALRRGRFKLIRRRPEGQGAAEFRLYDIADDPREQRDLAAQQPQRVAELDAELDRSRQRALAEAEAQGYRAAQEAQLSASDLDRLRELGYLEPAPAPAR